MKLPKGHHRAKENEKFKHINLEMETSTHFPLLIAAVQRTSGQVLELGSGLFSTPLLHWLCFKRTFITVPARKLITCESYPHYMEFANKFKTATHEIRFVEDWQKEKFDGRYSVVFIDHSPKKPWTRGDDALRFQETADFVILHDAGPDPDPKYGYQKVYPHFKHVWHWTQAWPHTTIMSNLREVTVFHV